MLNNIKVGDIYKGTMNGKIIKIIDIIESKDTIVYESNGSRYTYGLNAFKHCLLEKIN